MLGDDEVVALFEFFKFFDGVDIDGTHGVELALEFADEGFDQLPVGAGYFELGNGVVVLSSSFADIRAMLRRQGCRGCRAIQCRGPWLFAH